MDYKFSNLLGAPYRGGDLLLHGTTLLSPTGNRVSQVRSPTSPSAAGVGSLATRARAPCARSCGDAHADTTALHSAPWWLGRRKPHAEP
jgi:periodic tryptophan protein 2